MTGHSRAPVPPGAAAGACNTGWDGIQTVGSSHGTTIVGNDIARTRTGIYVEHETTRSLIAGNIRDTNRRMRRQGC